MNVLAADVGGTSIRAALVSAAGEILTRRTAPTPPDPVEGLATVARLWSQCGEGAGKAMVVAGGVRDSDGEITESPNLRLWEGTRPGRELGCLVLNDANGAALGELWRGALRPFRHAIMLTLGTGVGGGILIHRMLWTGANGCAGEVGHVPFGDVTLETQASATAVAALAGAPDAATAAAAARNGDEFALAAFAKAGRALGVALAGLVNVLNPEAICIGGGMSGAFDLLEPSMRAELDARAFRLALENLSVFPAALGGDAGLLGAAYLALEKRL